MRRRQERLRYAKTVAMGCDQLPAAFHGKEGVDGSSPSEGSAKPCNSGESDDAIHATRIIRASLHGFVSLEASNGFGLPLDIDETFARLTQLLDRGLAARAPVEWA
jgi:hypothetical protein